MLSSKKLVFCWLVSVLVSIGLPVVAGTLARETEGLLTGPPVSGPVAVVETHDPSPEADLLQQPEASEALGELDSIDEPELEQPELGAWDRVFEGLDDPLIDEDVHRQTILKGEGAFLRIGNARDASTGQSTGPVVAGRFDLEPEGDVVALTFDDGPHPTYTAEVLDVLAKYGQKATFFVVGDLSKNQPELLRRIAEEGHEIGNHGYSHRANHATTLPAYIDEIEMTSEIVLRETGKDTRWYRPNSMLMTSTMLVACQRTDHKPVVWSIDTRDWSAVGADAIVSAADPHNIVPGSVVLMHDGGGTRENTVKALERILEVLQNRGFSSVTMSELAAQSNI